MKKYPPIMKNVPHILYGGDYNPEQWRSTREIWREDMRLAKLAGCNTLTVGVFSWAALEPEEGRYDFAWLDEVMDMMHANGITAVLATPSGARPAWMAKKYPEVLRVDAERRRQLFGGRHNHCFSSPVYREKTRQVNSLLAERYKAHPALGLWHISNEYSGECHCPLCQQAFRAWLRQRYGSLDELNRAWWSAFWSHTYTDWEQIESPSPIGENESQGHMLDWRRFVSHQTIDFMKAEMEPLRRITPGVPCTTNMMEFFDGFDYTAAARELDIVSWDSYPRWRMDESDGATAMRTSMAHDMFRCLKDGRPFMLMESTPSVTNWQPVAKLKRPGMLAQGGLQAIAHGSDTVQYFQFRKSRGSFEKLHGALVDHEGSEHTRVFREAAALGCALKGFDEVLGTARPADVAVVYDVENRWALKLTCGLRYEKEYVKTVQEHYAPFWKAGVTVDVIDSTKDFTPYKLVIAPMLYMLRPGVAERLRSFVERGGTLVATYVTGWVDERDLTFLGGFPGPLKDMLGIWDEETDCLFDGESRAVTWNEREYLAREFCALVHTKGATQLASYDEDFYKGMPALTVHSFGQGKAYYVAARMDDSFQTDFADMLMEDLGIEKPFGSDLPAGCTAQTRTDGENDYIFLMNFMPYPEFVDLGEGGVSLLSGEELSGKNELAEHSVEVIKRKSMQ